MLYQKYNISELKPPQQIYAFMIQVTVVLYSVLFNYLYATCNSTKTLKYKKVWGGVIKM